MVLRPITDKNAPPQETLEGTVERVTFHSEESGFCVLRVKCAGVRDVTTVVGTLPNVVPGEMITAQGAWVMSKDHGRQFKSEKLETQPPESLKGIERFLGSGLIKGIGPVYAAKLVEKFGKGVFDIIENRSAVLEQIEGIGPIRRLRIKESWKQTKTIRAIMSFLMAHGVSTARAFRIYKTYGDEAIQLVREDPYRLSRDIRGIGFKSADQIAMHLGIEKDSDIRARAGVEHILREVTTEGHCAFLRADLVVRAAEILDISDEIIQSAIDYGVENKRLVTWVDPLAGGEYIYLCTLFEAEVSLSATLLTLSEGRHPFHTNALEAAVDWSEKQMGIQFDPAQKQAVTQAMLSKVLVITGGPGVGKTTIIQAVKLLFEAKKLTIVMCAPTGRAAKRMFETTGNQAKTIHRLLGFDPKKGGFIHNERNPLEGDVFIVDEASMLDLQLAWSLIRSIPKKAVLVLVGDVNQLPSVGPGSVLSDIIESEAIAVCSLTKVFRQAAQSDIICNAHRINQGLMPVFKEKGHAADCFMAVANEPEDGVEKIIRLIRDAIPQRFGMDPRSDVQVLCPMRRGVLGSQNLNAVIQQAVNGRSKAIERFGYRFAVGDKVMQTENDYDKDVFNGDIGMIHAINTEEQELTVTYDDRRVSYDFMELDEIVPAYAITIHKSQGSEYPCVIMPVHTQHYVMLQRNLIYTGLTRGRRLVVLVGTAKALSIAVKRQDSRKRITFLRYRLSYARARS
ncbi:MAG: ATP-dependent RecD-like DNA helicase [Spartobacteria bacterium]|nr:ATP-dependent RecD-like DNA helicase [Spartobacteria bacterium]